MLVDYEYRNGKLIVSYINDYGNIKLKYYNWPNPTKYVLCEEDDSERSGKYTTWDGRTVKQIYTRYPDRHSVYNFLDALPEEDQKLIFDYKEPEIFFIDIENEILDEKIDPLKANGEIQTISIVNKDKVLVIGTKKFSKSQSDSVESNINNQFAKFDAKYEFLYKHYETEYDLLLNFFKVLVPKMPVITGWYVINYDWVYLVNRARHLGIDPSVASFTGVLRQSWEQNDNSELPAHRVIVDMMDVYAKWDTSIKVKESNSLDFVSDNVLGVKKVNYEGNLKYLYASDYTKFVLYNAVDSILVQQIHNKMKYIDILYGISTLSRVRVIDAFKTLPVTEGILRGKMRDEKNIVFVKDATSKESLDNTSMSVKGGWVKDPIVGMNTWTCCFDFKSLYPFSIMEFNISADSFKGLVIKDKGKNIYDVINKLYNTDKPVYSIFNGHKIELDRDDIITINGAVFSRKDGVVKKVMGEIYKERKKYQTIMRKENEELKELERELKILETELG